MQLAEISKKLTCVDQIAASVLTLTHTVAVLAVKLDEIKVLLIEQNKIKK